MKLKGKDFIPGAWSWLKWEVGIREDKHHGQDIVLQKGFKQTSFFSSELFSLKCPYLYHLPLSVRSLSRGKKKKKEAFSCFIVHLKCLFLTQTSLLPSAGINFAVPSIFMSCYAFTRGAPNIHFSQLPKSQELKFSVEAKVADKYHYQRINFQNIQINLKFYAKS